MGICTLARKVASFRQF